jgi:hypothetical protein
VILLLLIVVAVIVAVVLIPVGFTLLVPYIFNYIYVMQTNVHSFMFI